MVVSCSSPPTHFFTLSAVPPANANRGGVALRPPIEVGDVPVPAVLDRNAIVVSGGGDRLDISSRDQWGAPLGRLIRQTLTADLITRLPPGSVLAPGSTAPKSGLRVVSVSIQRFGGDTAGNVVLDANWSLLKAGSSDVLRTGHEMIRVQAASGAVPDIVPAMSQALGQFADRIAAGVSG
ncbi:MAG TPA: PqiC family protein [Acetobacteraceae bacterium]|nr:PqiC family protein [Acetobacteraceae bacterium]